MIYQQFVIRNHDVPPGFQLSLPWKPSGLRKTLFWSGPQRRYIPKCLFRWDLCCPPSWLHTCHHSSSLPGLKTQSSHSLLDFGCTYSGVMRKAAESVLQDSSFQNIKCPERSRFLGSAALMWTVTAAQKICFLETILDSYHYSTLGLLL